MKNFVYSTCLKIIAVVLFVVSTVLATLAFTDGVGRFAKEKISVYNFESSFNECAYIEDVLYDIEYVFFDVYRECEDDGNFEEALTKKLRERLLAFHNADKMDYYIKYNENIFTNCGATNEKDFRSSDFYSCVELDESGNLYRDTMPATNYVPYYLESVSPRDGTQSLVVSACLKKIL